MHYYKKITVFENKKRIRELTEFRNLTVKYFNNTETSIWSTINIKENHTAKEVRVKINKKIGKATKTLTMSGIVPTILYTPPPSAGGIAGNINLMANIFSLYRFQLDPQILIDHIERAIGVYEEDSKKALLRTINPFFWANRLLSFVADIPFQLLGTLGFNKEKIKQSFLGKLLKGSLYLLELFATLLAILYYLDLLESFKTYFENISKNF